MSLPNAKMDQSGKSLRTAIANASEEAEAIERIAENLQKTLGEILHARRKTDAKCYELQALDLLNQSIGNLATFLRALSRVTPAEWHVDVGSAARLVTLMDMADRLSDAAKDNTSPAPTFVAGECDFFD